MDHTEAVRSQAVVKYVLGELSEILREEFEEHYFQCAECARDLQATVEFASACRQIFRLSA